MTELQLRTLNWIANGDTGHASLTVALWLVFGIRKETSPTPVLPSEFYRCVKLLRLMPELRSEIPKLAELSPEWKCLAAHWDDAESTVVTEAESVWDKDRLAVKTSALLWELRDNKTFNFRRGVRCEEDATC